MPGIPTNDEQKAYQESLGVQLKDMKDPEMEFDVMEDVYSNMDKILTYEIRESRITPCANHPTKRIQYICKTDRLGLCAQCLFPHYKQSHEILSLEEVI